jgi:hypothetical protein
MYVTKVHARNKGLGCSRKQTDIAPKISMFCALNAPFLLIISVRLRFVLKDTDINGTSNSVHICTAWSLPLLRALRFPQHNNMMFQQADCIHSLVFILWRNPH